MITRSLSHQRPRQHRLPAGQRRSPVAGPRHKGAFPGCGRARRPGPHRASCSGLGTREQAERATQSQQLLVVHYQPEQSEQRVERELQRRQREQRTTRPTTTTCEPSAAACGDGPVSATVAESAVERAAPRRRPSDGRAADLYSFENLWRQYRDVPPQQAQHAQPAPLRARRRGEPARAAARAARAHLPARAARSASSPTGRSRARCSPRTSATASSITCSSRSRSAVFEPRVHPRLVRLPSRQGRRWPRATG